ncbi:MAG: hypothetical protein NTW28_24590 [Candidatus Solibacter sp.]|nr:hypothetical protein [Candidatus Solibacter sp.]
MPESKEQNLDHLAATRAVDMSLVVAGDVTPEKAETILNKALGVVTESGPFACGVFLLTRCGSGRGKSTAEEATATATLRALLRFGDAEWFQALQPRFDCTVRDFDVHSRPAKKLVVDHLLKISAQPLEKLLLVQKAWEQSLTYARHIVRAQREKP